MTLDDLLKQQLGSSEALIAKLASAPADVFGAVMGEEIVTDPMSKQASSGATPTEEVLKLANLCDLAGDQLAKVAGEAVAVPNQPAGGTDNPQLVTPEEGKPKPDTSGAATVSLPSSDGLVGGQDVPNTGTTVTPPGEGASMKVGGVDAETLRIYQILKMAAQSEGATAVPNTGTDPGIEGQGLPANANKIDTPAKAQDLKPRQAVEQEKQDLKKLLDEPAMSATTDPVLKNNLDHVEDAGPKIAAYREYLSKIAEQGCTCDGAGTCAYCQIKEALAADFEGVEGETAAAPAEDAVGTAQGPAAATQAIRF